MSEEETKTPADASAPASEDAAPAEAAPAEKAGKDDEKVPYQIVETVSLEGSVKQFKVSVPREIFVKRTEKMYKDLGTNVVIEGFRRGKAPRRLLEIRYGKDVQEDVVNTLASSVAEQLIEAEKLQVIGEPELKSSTVEKDNPVELVLEVEVAPEVKVQGYEGLEVEIEEVRVSEDLVDAELERLRQANAQFKTAPAGAKFNPGDGAVIDYQVLDQKGERLERQCATDRFEQDLGARVPPELAKLLPGLEPGQTVAAQITSTHHTRRGEVRETTDSHKLTLKEIKIRELPKLDDEFAKDLGEFDSLEALKSRIRDELRAHAERRERQASLDAVFAKILEANPFEAPKTVVSQSALNMVGGTARRLASYGISLSDLDEQTQRNYIQNTRTDAERLVKADMAIGAIAKGQNIAVANEDVDRAIERMAEREGRRPLAIRARLEKEKQLDALRSELLTEKVHDFLLSKTKVSKVEPKPKAPEEAAAPAEAEGQRTKDEGQRNKE